MKKTRALVFCAAIGCAVGAWLFWNVSPSTLESRLLTTSAKFIGSVQKGDRLSVLQLSVSERESLESARYDKVVASGEFRVPELAKDQPIAAAPGSVWDPPILEKLRQVYRQPVSYSLNTDPDTPSIMLNFDCPIADEQCLEHLKIFFTPRAHKIDSYIMFWNDEEWRKVWSEFYSKGLVTKPCDDICPF